MLDKIIKELEAKGKDIHNNAFLSGDYNVSVKCAIQLETIREAIQIIKQHEPQFKEAIEEAVTYGNPQEFYDGTETLAQDYYNQKHK